MIVLTELPRYELAGLVVRPGDIIGRTKFGSIIEHTFLLRSSNGIAHTAGPGDAFRPGWLDEVLKDGGVLQIVDATGSLRETRLRFAYANQIVGVLWWDMNCRQATNFIAKASRNALVHGMALHSVAA